MYRVLGLCVAGARVLLLEFGGAQTNVRAKTISVVEAHDVMPTCFPVVHEGVYVY